MSKSRKSRYVLYFLVIVGIACIVGYEQTHRKRMAPPRIGDMASSWVMEDLLGKEHSSASLEGKVVLLNFSTAWSPFYKTESDLFKGLQSDYASAGLQVISISLDESAPTKIAGFVESLKLNYPVLLATVPVTEAYGPIDRVPTSFLIDRDGKIVGIYKDVLNRGAVEATIKDLL